MTWPPFDVRAVLSGLFLGGCASSGYSAEPLASSHAVPSSAAVAHPSAEHSSMLADDVRAEFRDAVLSVSRQPTLTVKASEDEFVAHGHVYDWLLEHPDRAALAWRRLKVPCVEISECGGKFHWADDGGNELTWEAVGRQENSMIWYATGKVKPGLLMPTIPVKAVAVLTAPRQSQDEKLKTSCLKPTVAVYLQTDSRAASAMLRILGPAAPHMAEQAAEQFLLFFSGVARHIHSHPEEAPFLLAPAKTKTK